ncbi:DegT/DnrJ/EryC1/StrS family aminotransferase [Candidatus Woesearchaeota archaeon]|nr:DegT/DnrJ/EryC1/StrS family aminotransferase [Candidatus Woesearchaeota archaeon]
MNIPFVDLKAQYSRIKDEIDAKISEVVSNADFIMGQNVEKFEKEFAQFCNAKFCSGVSSGTSALHLALKAAGIKQGDEVITVANTFIATTEAISQVGATIKFVDCDPVTYTIDVKQIEKAITSKTKAILPVHLYGQCADVKAIREIANKHNLLIIEDAAQAHGAEHHGKRVPVGDIACFSFYPGKNLGAYGDAGAVVTNNEKIAELVNAYRNHGRLPGEKYEHSLEGYNERIDALQAAILSIKLKYLCSWNNMRRKNAVLYNELLADVKEIVTPIESSFNKHIYHLYVIRILDKNREKIMEALKKQGIATQIHYPIPLHEQKAYKHLNIIKGAFPISEQYAKQIISLPMFPEMTEEQIHYVCEKLKEALKE